MKTNKEAIQEEMSNITVTEQEIGFILFNEFCESILKMIRQYEAQIDKGTLDVGRILNIALINLLANVASS